MNQNRFPAWPLNLSSRLRARRARIRDGRALERALARAHSPDERQELIALAARAGVPLSGR